MPNNKKKKGKAKHRKAHHDDGQCYDDLPSFPPPENTEETIQRLLGYEHTSFFDRTHGGTSCKLSLGSTSNTLNVDVDGEKGSYEVLVNDLDHIGKSSNFQIFPDYDRDAATFPIFDRLSRPKMSVKTFKRRSRACLHSVPANQREIYEQFIDCCDRADSMKIVCRSVPIDTADYGQDYAIGITCSLLGHYHGESFYFARTNESMIFRFFGTCGRDPSTICLEKYISELSVLLAYVIMSRTSEGTVDFQGEASNDYIMATLLSCLRVMNTEQKRWSEVLGLSIKAMEHAIESRSSLTNTCSQASALGEALEAHGLFDHAALIYAETGDHMYKAEHFDTTTLYSHAALAWERAGKYEGAQRFYAKALRCLHFIHDLDYYHDRVFYVLQNLFIMFDNRENSRYLKHGATLRALIVAAGEELYENGGPTFYTNYSAQPLRPSLRDCGKDRIIRAVQSIVDKSISAEGMREAILDCSNLRPAVVMLKVINSNSSADNNNQDSTSTASTPRGNTRRPKNRPKDFAREFLQTHHDVIGGYITQCAGCGEWKREKTELKSCVCNTAYYCNEECARAHWNEHKAQCKAARKAMRQTK